MATIEKRVDSTGFTTYRVKVRLKGYSQETASFHRRTDAKHWAANIESAMREGRHFNKPESKVRTLGESIERYQKEVLPNLKDQSNRRYHLAWWADEIGVKVLADIRSSTISECRSKLKLTPSNFGKHKGKGKSDATINRYLATLSALLSIAVREWGWLESNPCKNVRRSKELRGRVRFLSDKERIDLLVACENSKLPELKIIFLVAITTGARRGEIMNLRWRHIDFKSNSITLVDTKNGDTRSVPLVNPALKKIKEWAKIRSIDEGGFVFPGRTDRTKNKSIDFDKAWRGALSLSGVTDFRFHDLRHTAASYLAMNGAGIREIGDILGHKSLAMVQRYSHLTDDHKRATVERMATAVFGSSI
jgi:integrase